jgi:hypothetical protein
MPGFCIILSSASGGRLGPRTPRLKGRSLRSLHFPSILTKIPSIQNLNETTAWQNIVLNKVFTETLIRIFFLLIEIRFVYIFYSKKSKSSRSVVQNCLASATDLAIFSCSSKARKCPDARILHHFVVSFRGPRRPPNPSPQGSLASLTPFSVYSKQNSFPPPIKLTATI